MNILRRLLYTLAFLLIAFACSSNATEKQQELAALQERVINFIKPYRTQIQKWFWRVSGVTYNNPFASGNPSSLATFVDCEVCTQVAPFLKQILQAGISEGLLIQIITLACITLDLAPARRICQPTVEKYARPFTYIFRDNPNINLDDFCGILNPGCSPVSEHLTSWKIRLNNEKPLIKPRPLPPSSIALSKIIHFTDIHLDLHYTPGKNTICGLPACCRVENGDPANETVGAKKFGNLGCGLPTEGLDAMYQHARDAHHDARFIFLTGDFIHSNVWEYGQEENRMHLGNVSLMLKKKFEDTSVEIYPLIGNHEPDICNLYPPESAWGNFSLTWMYDAVIQPYEEYIPANQVNLFRKYGYYSVQSKMDRNLRIVVLNTNLCYIDNFWLPTAPIDPFNQLQWFADTMDLAERFGQKVFIIGHISPGSYDCWPTWSHQFNRVITRYEAIIKGQWYGHEHEQNYKITFAEGTNRPISVSYVDGSGLPDGMNPAYNVFYADGERGNESTWEIVNHETWILNLTASNSETELAVFSQILDAQAHYKVRSLVPEEVHKFINSMICDDELFLKYQKVTIKGEDSPRFKPCGNDVACKSVALRNLFLANTADVSHRDELERMILSVDCSETEVEGKSHSLVPSSIIGWTLSLITLLVGYYGEMY